MLVKPIWIRARNCFAKVLFVVAALFLALVAANLAHADYRLDRWYRMGDSSIEQNNTTVDDGVPGGIESSGAFFFIDSAAAITGADQQNLRAPGSDLRPTYVEYGQTSNPSRPVAANTSNNFGIRFDGVDDYLTGPNVNDPSDSNNAAANGYTTRNRGFQLWAMPEDVDGSAEYLVDDADLHGYRINTGGVFLSETRDATVNSGVSAVNGTWYHLALVRPDGDGGGSLAYVNGIASGSQTGNYADASPGELLMLGANNEATADVTNEPPAEFFTGIIDELEFQVYDAANTYSYTEDNGYFTDVFLPSQSGYGFTLDANGLHNSQTWEPGDINFDGTFNQGDIDAFIAGWNSSIGDLPGPGPQFGDYVTLGLGDLDLDGDTDLLDWSALRTLSNAAGLQAPSLAQLNAQVPEPSTIVLAATGIVAVACARRRS